MSAYMVAVEPETVDMLAAWRLNTPSIKDRREVESNARRGYMRSTGLPWAALPAEDRARLIIKEYQRTYGPVLRAHEWEARA